jgi:hypothetical protein
MSHFVLIAEYSEIVLSHVSALRRGIPIVLCRVHNERNTTHQCTTFVVTTVKAATCFDYVKYPPSGCNYQKREKEHYTPVALYIIIKLQKINGQDRGLTENILQYIIILYVATYGIYECYA